MQTSSPVTAHQSFAQSSSEPATERAPRYPAAQHESSSAQVKRRLEMPHPRHTSGAARGEDGGSDDGRGNQQHDAGSIPDPQRRDFWVDGVFWETHPWLQPPLEFNPDVPYQHVNALSRSKFTGRYIDSHVESDFTRFFFLEYGPNRATPWVMWIAALLFFVVGLAGEPNYALVASGVLSGVVGTIMFFRLRRLPSLIDEAEAAAVLAEGKDDGSSPPGSAGTDHVGGGTRRGAYASRPEGRSTRQRADADEGSATIDLFFTKLQARVRAASGTTGEIELLTALMLLTLVPAAGYEPSAVRNICGPLDHAVRCHAQIGIEAMLVPLVGGCLLCSRRVLLVPVTAVNVLTYIIGAFIAELEEFATPRITSIVWVAVFNFAFVAVGMLREVRARSEFEHLVDDFRDRLRLLRTRGRLMRAIQGRIPDVQLPVISSPPSVRVDLSRRELGPVTVAVIETVDFAEVTTWLTPLHRLLMLQQLRRTVRRKCLQGGIAPPLEAGDAMVVMTPPESTLPAVNYAAPEHAARLVGTLLDIVRESYRARDLLREADVYATNNALSSSMRPAGSVEEQPLDRVSSNVEEAQSTPDGRGTPAGLYAEQGPSEPPPGTQRKMPAAAESVYVWLRAGASYGQVLSALNLTGSAPIGICGAAHDAAARIARTASRGEVRVSSAAANMAGSAASASALARTGAGPGMQQSPLLVTSSLEFTAVHNDSSGQPVFAVVDRARPMGLLGAAIRGTVGSISAFDEASSRSSFTERHAPGGSKLFPHGYAEHAASQLQLLADESLEALEASVVASAAAMAPMSPSVWSIGPFDAAYCSALLEEHTLRDAVFSAIVAVLGAIVCIVDAAVFTPQASPLLPLGITVAMCVLSALAFVAVALLEWVAQRRAAGHSASDAADASGTEHASMSPRSVNVVEMTVLPGSSPRPSHARSKVGTPLTVVPSSAPGHGSPESSSGPHIRTVQLAVALVAGTACVCGVVASRSATLAADPTPLFALLLVVDWGRHLGSLGTRLVVRVGACLTVVAFMVTAALPAESHPPEISNAHRRLAAPTLVVLVTGLFALQAFEHLATLRLRAMSQTQLSHIAESIRVAAAGLGTAIPSLALRQVHRSVQRLAEHAARRETCRDPRTWRAVRVEQRAEDAQGNALARAISIDTVGEQVRRAFDTRGGRPAAPEPVLYSYESADLIVVRLQVRKRNALGGDGGMYTVLNDTLSKALDSVHAAEGLGRPPPWAMEDTPLCSTRGHDPRSNTGAAAAGSSGRTSPGADSRRNSASSAGGVPLGWFDPVDQPWEGVAAEALDLLSQGRGAAADSGDATPTPRTAGLQLLWVAGDDATLIGPHSSAGGAAVLRQAARCAVALAHRLGDCPIIGEGVMALCAGTGQITVLGDAKLGLSVDGTVMNEANAIIRAAPRAHGSLAYATGAFRRLHTPLTASKLSELALADEERHHHHHHVGGGSLDDSLSRTSDMDLIDSLHDGDLGAELEGLRRELQMPVLNLDNARRHQQQRMALLRLREMRRRFALGQRGPSENPAVFSTPQPWALRGAGLASVSIVLDQDSAEV